MEKLDEVWETLVTCHTHPEKYTSKTLEPIVKFKRYKAPLQACRYQEFYSLLRVAMIRARGVHLLCKPIN